ncbi:MAG: hypothetical protein M3P08_07925 [Thermoproteota archaeon]|nr:hypothetical protein [Thermoproteota archaeon]
MSDSFMTHQQLIYIIMTSSDLPRSCIYPIIAASAATTIAIKMEFTYDDKDSYR